MNNIEFEGDILKVFLNGDKTLSIPLLKFPGIKKLSTVQRSKYHVAGGISLDFEESDEVYHINEFLGI